MAGVDRRRWFAGWSQVGERGGQGSIEAVLLVPAIMVLIMLVIAGGRIAIVTTSIETAARAAARAAALETNAATAASVADQIARANMAAGGVKCVSASVTTDTSGFAVAVGVPASVEVSVSCTIGLADLLVPGLGGTRTITQTVSVPLDTYRSRGER